MIERHIRTRALRADRGKKRQSVAQQLEEMIALEALARQRPLSARESERLGELVAKEQRRAEYRPARIAHLRAELALLESLEIAEKGPAALPRPKPGEVEMVQTSAGVWSPERRAA